MRRATGWRKNVCSLTTTVLLLGMSCLIVVAAEEKESRFTNLHKGPDGLYHWEEKAVGEAEVALARGRQDFQKYCASCHGLAAKGDGPMADQLKTAPTDLTQLAAQKEGEFPFWDAYHTIDGREALAAHGGREMPVWGTEFKEEVPVRAAGPRWVLATQEGKAEAIVKDRILGLVLYLQSIQEG